MIGQEGTDVYPDRNTDPDVLGGGSEGFNNYEYFGTIPRSMFTLFSVVILAEWPEIVRPICEQQVYMFPFFILFIVLTTFGLANVIIGVIVDNTFQAAAQIDQEEQV